MSPETGRLLNLADKHAQQAGDQFISSESLLLAAVNDGKNSLCSLLLTFGNAAKLQKAVDKVRGGEKVTDQDAEGKRQALDKYTVDLTDRG